MAGVGMTESRARETIGSIAVYTSDFRAMKNVLAGRNERALYKMICDAETGRVVGLHMIGPDAPEILQIGRAHVWTPVTNAHLVCRLLLEKKNKNRQNETTRRLDTKT